MKKSTTKHKKQWLWFVSLYLGSLTTVYLAHLFGKWLINVLKA